jgi:hypothetical protein
MPIHPNEPMNRKSLQDMNWKKLSLYRRVHLIAVLIFLSGMSASAAIYFSAEDSSNNTFVDQFENSKLYRHNLEVIGGKMNVLADEFSRWFISLWHGRSLALTVAVITVFLSFTLFIVASYLPRD